LRRALLSGGVVGCIPRYFVRDTVYLNDIVVLLDLGWHKFVIGISAPETPPFRTGRKARSFAPRRNA